MDFKWHVRKKQDIQKFIHQLQFELAGMAHLAWLSNSLRCSRTCHEIPGKVRLRNGSQMLVLISRMDTRICVSISDWLVYYEPCDWSYSCELYHAMLKINIVACSVYIFVQRFALHFKRLKRLCLIRPFIVIYAVGSSKKNTKEFYSQKDGNNSTYSPRSKV